MNAVDYYKSGYSCSESIVKEAIDLGLCDESLLPVATSFSGGIGSGCLCGAVSGSEMVIGLIFGKNNKFGNEPIAREKAKEFMQNLKKNIQQLVVEFCHEVLSFNHKKENKIVCK